VAQFLQSSVELDQVVKTVGWKVVAAHPQSLANSTGTLASDIVHPLGSDILWGCCWMEDAGISSWFYAFTWTFCLVSDWILFICRFILKSQRRIWHIFCFTENHCPWSRSDCHLFVSQVICWFAIFSLMVSLDISTTLVCWGTGPKLRVTAERSSLTSPPSRTAPTTLKPSRPQADHSSGSDSTELPGNGLIPGAPLIPRSAAGARMSRRMESVRL